MVPNIVFIVPYRNREQQLFFFRNYMKYILKIIMRMSIKYFFTSNRYKRI